MKSENSSKFYNLRTVEKSKATSPNIIRVTDSRRIRWSLHVARMGEVRNAYGVLVGNPERRKPLGRSRHRWEDNIRMGLREIEWEGVDWKHLAQDM
jgi:hypothetical protein